MPRKPTPSVQRPLPEGSTIETVFEVRVQGDLNGALRAVLTSSFLRAVKSTTGLQALVIGYQVATSPKEKAE